MLFKKSNALRISRGAKSESRRLKKPRVKVGRTYLIRTSFFDKENWGRIKILDIRHGRLSAIADSSVRGEGCKSRGEFFEMFEKINGYVH